MTEFPGDQVVFQSITVDFNIQAYQVILQHRLLILKVVLNQFSQFYLSLRLSYTHLLAPIQMKA